MYDYISREGTIDALFAKIDEPKHAEFLYCDEIDSIIRNIPAADVVECKRGKWEEVSIANADDDEIQKIERVVSAKCPYCHKYHTEVFFYGTPMEETKYCPHCGADMR